MSNRFMRMIVFFDLPVKTAEERKIANKFRKSLIKDGYSMLQLSVYSRIVRGRDALAKHQKRLLQMLPAQGNVRCLEVTEKQYANMKLLVGLPKQQEKKVDARQFLLF
ncbi:MAG: CRISPR-associated endonuclease Cas2 [Neisseriaceae bacterium]|nr:CRISPR-associated endonuclease Cas2 [Neisseriaceae bacterium]